MNEHFSLKKYDPITVGKQAEAKYSNGELEEAQVIYQSALLEWQDDVREMGDNCDAMQLEQLRHAIASLWLSYANFNRQVKQVRLFACGCCNGGKVHLNVTFFYIKIFTLVGQGDAFCTSCFTYMFSSFLPSFYLHLSVQRK
jgi:hypothetical protein